MLTRKDNAWISRIDLRMSSAFHCRVRPDSCTHIIERRRLSSLSTPAALPPYVGVVVLVAWHVAQEACGFSILSLNSAETDHFILFGFVPRSLGGGKTWSYINRSQVTTSSSSVQQCSGINVKDGG